MKGRKVIRRQPVYRPEDPNCCPTGGTGVDVYVYRGGRFEAVEREWRSKGLKVLANATSYGIYAQMTRHERAGGRKEQVTVYGRADEPHTWPTPAPEDPGEFSFPPQAASITGGARLMLALLERLVSDRGGAYAFCDTDSMDDRRERRRWAGGLSGWIA